MGWGFWSTPLATLGIPNVAWKERQYERHIGMPSGRFFILAWFGDPDPSDWLGFASLPVLRVYLLGHDKALLRSH